MLADLAVLIRPTSSNSISVQSAVGDFSLMWITSGGGRRSTENIRTSWRGYLLPFQCWTFQRSYTERAMDGFGACPMLATARGGWRFALPPAEADGLQEPALLRRKRSGGILRASGRERYGRRCH